MHSDWLTKIPCHFIAEGKIEVSIILNMHFHSILYLAHANIKVSPNLKLSECFMTTRFMFTACIENGAMRSELQK